MTEYDISVMTDDALMRLFLLVNNEMKRRMGNNNNNNDYYQYGTGNDNVYFSQYN